MRKIERVEKRIHEIFHDKLQSGELVPIVGGFAYINENSKCGCLLGFVSVEAPALETSAAKLGISVNQAGALEEGFENIPLNHANTAYYKLGARIRRHYT